MTVTTITQTQASTYASHHQRLADYKSRSINEETIQFMLTDPSQTINERALVMLLENIETIKPPYYLLHPQQFPDEYLRTLVSKLFSRRADVPTNLLILYLQNKKESPEVIKNIFLAMEKQRHSDRNQDQQTKNLTRSLVADYCIHRQSSIRQAAAKALHVLILNDATILSDITSIVYRMATDQSTIVRELTVTMVDEWLRTIPDRWGYIARLLPILLAADHPLHFNYVEDRKRMGLHNDLENGSDDEFLLRDNFHKMVTLMIGNIEHFSAPIKIHAVKALTAAIYVVKARCTGIAIEVLLAVCKLLPTSDAALDESITRLLQAVGVHVSADVYLDLLLGEPRQAAYFTALAKMNRRFSEADLERIVASLISDKDTKSPQLLQSYHHLLLTLTNLYKPKDRWKIFEASLMLKALEASSLMTSTTDPYQMYCDSILESIQHCNEFERSLLLETARHSAQACVANKNFERILTAISDIDQVPANRITAMNCIIVVRDHLTDKEAYFRRFVRPNLIWRPGREAIVVRAAAIEATWYLDLNEADYDLVLNILDDELEVSRTYCLEILEKWIPHLTDHEVFSKATEEIVKRLDDTSDSLRNLAARVLGLLLQRQVALKSLPADPRDIDKICEALGTHSLDDNLQDACQQALRYNDMQKDQ